MSENLPIPVASAEDEARVQAGFWRKLRQNIHRLPFASDLLAAWFAARDPKTPRRVRWILYGALAYFLLPTDAVPDILAGLGFTDDAAVLIAALKSVAGSVNDRHREMAQLTLDRLRK
ncbi:YkvA family protein [Lacibacterium aquatile]|uniref:YkvA family protein n=1 Tax=Lacibacterium aquatile TaxID=1168082 RepID=A0ABW5DNV7_9PROT